MRRLAAILALLLAPLAAGAQVVYLVGDDLPPLQVSERLGMQDTLTVLVDTSGLAHYMVHRADSVIYRMRGERHAISRDMWRVITSNLADWVRAWEAIRRLGEQ